MSTSSKSRIPVPVVVLEMMEKLKDQKGKYHERSKKNSRDNFAANAKNGNLQSVHNQPPGIQKVPSTQTQGVQNQVPGVQKVPPTQTLGVHYQPPGVQKVSTTQTQGVQNQPPGVQKVPPSHLAHGPLQVVLPPDRPLGDPVHIRDSQIGGNSRFQQAHQHQFQNQQSHFPTPLELSGYPPPVVQHPSAYGDPPLEQLPHVLPMSPPAYVPQYALPAFPEAFHIHSHLPHCAQYHPCAMLPPPEYHCASGPVQCHVGQTSSYCCVDLNPPTSPGLKRQPSYMQMPLSLKMPQQPPPEFRLADAQSPIENIDNHLDLGKGSMVEVMVDGMPYYGVIRWLGHLYAAQGDIVAGIEMEQEHELFCDGEMQNKQRFICNPKRGHFVPLFQCRRDPRFIESHCTDNPSYPPEQEFGGPSCPIIPGAVPPLNKEKNIEALCGKMRGIQGHHNSCYLDATLFAMFTFTSVFDSLLFKPASPDIDSPHYTQVQTVLREEIVNPLRTNVFVRADRVMHLRHLLNELSNVSGLTSEEKDPEEFLTSLVAQILKAEPFLKLSSGQETYHYQLFVEKDEKLRLPTVQQLFEQSFFTSDIKLKEVPSSLIIQMPRFGKSYKMYPRILPSQLLDITDVLEASPRQCTICGKLADVECRKCFDQCDSGLASIWYCRTCLERTHTHEKRTDHESCWRQLCLPDYFLYDQECPVSRVYMELFAVVCIETSHYVAFVKGGAGCDAPWCFFDSMADRKGERNGYNIPEMVPCPELPYWLSEEGSHQLNNIADDRQLPEYAKRLMCDAYMVMYQSPDLMMYR